MADGTFWVIETARHEYWDGKGDNRHSFTGDIDKAVKFYSEYDGEVIRCYILEDMCPLLRTTAHSYLKPIIT